MTKQKKSLSAERPELLEEWDYEKNALISSPDEIAVCSNKKVWWKCANGHSWQATPNNRTNGTGCPFCSGRSREKGINDLATTNPDLLSEWDYEKNKLICSPDNISAGSHKTVYWKCKNGHSWKAEIRRRAEGSNCPFCSNKRRLLGFNDFATRYPELLSEWDYERNVVKPTELMPSSHKKVWWICSICGEKWQAELSNRTAGAGCPSCGRNKAAKGRGTAAYKKSIAFLYPELLKEWDYEKNGREDPNTIYPGSTRKVWWICPKCNQHYQALVGSRVKGAACPICAGKVIADGINDLETWCKENDRQYILDEWDYDKNTISPKEIAPFSSKRIWFMCKQGHSYSSALSNRTGSNRTGCPICRRKGTSFQEQAFYYYLEKKYSKVVNSYHDSWLGKFELDMYLPEIKIAVEYDGIAWHKSNQKDENDRIKNKLCKENGVRLIRVRENGLPTLHDCECIIVENRSSQALNKSIESLLALLGKKCDNSDVDVDRDTAKIVERFDYRKKENSIASLYPELLKEWDYEKNGRVNPEYVNYGSVRKYWWKCSECGNEYLMSPNYRTYQKQGCPICSKSKRIRSRIESKLSDKGSLATNATRLLKEWDYEKNALPPDCYLMGSKQKVWWKCPVCGGNWQTKIYQRTKENGTGCPYCSGRKVLQGVNDLATKYPNLVDEWMVEKNHGLHPTDYTSGSSQKILWTCRTCGNEWMTTIHERTMGRGCPKCARKRVAQKQSKSVTCVETGEIFLSIKEAASWAGIKDSTLVTCLKGKIKSAGGYHWKYSDDE